MNRPLLFLLFSVIAPAQQYVMSTVAGGVPPVTPAEAAGVAIGDPPRVAVDSAGNTYFGSLHSIYKVTPGGALIRIAGTGRAGLAGDGGPAIVAQLDYPVGIAVDGGANVYYTERNSAAIRRVSADGAISTLGIEGLRSPMGLAFDSAGNLYVADTGANAVRRIAPNGTMTTVAGNGAAGFSGDGGPALSAALNGPEGVALDRAGNVYIADTFNHRVRAVAPDGTISTFAGNGFPGSSGDEGEATSASMILPTDVAADSAGNIYIADLGNSAIRRVANGVIATIAGNSGGLPPRDGLRATAVRLSGPTGVAVDANGAVYVAEGSIGSGSGLDGGAFRIWKVTPAGLMSTLAGIGLRSYSGDSGPAALAQFDRPAGLAFDAKGNLYIADSQNNRVRKISTDGIVTTVAGNALPGFSGESGPAYLAQLNRPTGVAVDFAGNLFIADSGNNRVRMVLPNGIIGTLAGNGNTAFFGDGGNSARAALNNPTGVAVDADGAIYIADTGNHRIRRVFSAVIETVADGLNEPSGVAVDENGVVYVADSGDGTVRGLFKGGTMTVPLPGARGITIDRSGAIYAAGSDRVVKIAQDGGLTTIAGTGQCCYSGDGGPAAAARLNRPWGLAADASGNLYIADNGNDAIRVAVAGASTFFIRSVVNAASNQAGSVAPGEIVTIYGAGLGAGNLVSAEASAGVLPTEVAGTSVLVNGIAAPLLYVSAGQVSAIVPYGVTGSSAQFVVRVGNASTQPFPLPIAPAAPGLFTADATGGGQARAINADGSANGAAHPAPAGTTLMLFATGEGQTSPAGADGRTVSNPAPQPQATVTVTIGGQPATVDSIGGIPGATAGVMQVTVTVPAGVSGQAPVVMTVGSATSQTGVTVAVL